MSAAALTCRELVELVTEFLEGTLAAGERRRFEAHVAECDGCAAYLAQMRDTLRITGRLREESLPDEARDALMRVFRAWKER